MSIEVESECTNCDEEKCTDGDCRKEQQLELDAKNLRYFRGGRSLDDLITEKLSEQDV